MRSVIDLLLLGLVFALQKPSSATCPKGSVQGQNDSDCYLYISTPDSWFKAEDLCVILGGHLASIHDAFTNAFLPNQACTSACSSASPSVWLGGYWNDTASAWQWSDGSGFDYADWSVGEPSLRSGACVSMSVWSSEWSTVNCHASSPFICKVPSVSSAQCPSPKPVTCPERTPSPSCTTPQPVTTTCPSGWTKHTPRGKCYRAVCNVDAKNASASCQNQGGTLASMHNLDDNNWLNQFGLKSCPSNTDSWNGAMWLGIFDVQLAQNWTTYNWQWADGSAMDFTNWRQYQPDGEGYQRCVSINGWADGVGQWDDSDCSIQMQAAVCQTDLYLKLR